MNLYEMYGVEQKLVDEGVKFQFGHAWIKLKYAGRENQGYYNALITHLEAYQDLFTDKGKLKNKIDDKKIAEALIGVYSDHIFIAWDGFQDRNAEGKDVDLPNTKQAFFDLCVKYPKFFDEISKHASGEKNFQKEEAELKN